MIKVQGDREQAMSEAEWKQLSNLIENDRRERVCLTSTSRHPFCSVLLLILLAHFCSSDAGLFIGLYLQQNPRAGWVECSMQRGQQADVLASMPCWCCVGQAVHFSGRTK